VLHAGALPLGCGWTGHCTAPGHENAVHRRRNCGTFATWATPKAVSGFRRAGVGFGTVRGADVPGDKKNFTGGHIQIRYVCERDHRPVEHGTLKFDAVAENWLLRHSDDRVQRMAECFMATYVRRGRSLK